MATRIGMMLPGAVSLGAYEGGALAAILKAVQESHGELVVDAIASASAGSMTALIAARALLSGAEPVTLMEQTWVQLPQLDELKTTDMSAPLTMANLLDTAKELLGQDRVPDGTNRQAESVRLSMALTVLGGLTYAVPHLRDPKDPDPSQTVLGSTYVDFFTSEIRPGASTADFIDVLEAAMASGSTPVGFPPRQLNRDDVRDEYKKRGILAPAGRPFRFWYSDGGDIDNQPFGRLLDLIGAISEADGDERVIVMLNIEPGAPPTWNGTWFDEGPAPSWLSTLLHVNHIRSGQSLYDDLLQLEKTNSRIGWIKSVAAALEASLEASLDGPAQGRLAAVVSGAATDVAEDRRKIRAAIREAAGAPAPDAAEPVVDVTLEDLLLQAAGLDEKRQVVVEIISPETDGTGDLTAQQQLSGEFLYHFGGFFAQKYRESDFALGYRNARAWLGWWLDGRVADPAAVLAAVDAGYSSLPWKPESYGEASVKTLSIKEKVEGIDLLGHIQRVVVHDVDAAAALEVEVDLRGVRRLEDAVERHIHPHGG